MWKMASTLNAHHGLFAWISLPMVMVTDAYVRTVSVGWIQDPHIVLFR
jgi:hypothetical protein